ncbi:RidA family protein [soil metagenome]
MIDLEKPVRIDVPGETPRATFAAAIAHQGVLYLAGIVPTGPDGQLIGRDDPAAQAKACVDRIEQVLAAAGATLDDILRATCFGTTAEAVGAYIAERNSRLSERVAATSVLVSGLLVPGAMLEVEVIARMPAAR